MHFARDHQRFVFYYHSLQRLCLFRLQIRPFIKVDSRTITIRVHRTPKIRPNSPFCPNNSKDPNYTGNDLLVKRHFRTSNSSFWASSPNRPKTRNLENFRTGRTLFAEQSEHLLFELWRTLIPEFFPDAHQNDEIKLGTVPNIPFSNSFVIKYSSRLSCGSNTSHISPYFLAITKIHHFSVAPSFSCKTCILTCITA